MRLARNSASASPGSDRRRWVPATVALLLALGFRLRNHWSVAAVPGRTLPLSGNEAPLAADRFDRLKQIVRDVRAGVRCKRVVPVAAGVTFFALLAVFPAIAAVVSMYGLVADPA